MTLENPVRSGWFRDDESVLSLFVKDALDAVGPAHEKRIKVKRGCSGENGEKAAITGLVMKRANLSGPLFARNTALPSALVLLDVEDNKLSGTFNFGLLPPGLQVLNLSFNCFTGEVTALPPALVSLRLQCNKFSGFIDLSLLPQNLTEAYFQDNCFTSVANSRRLPSLPPSDQLLCLESGVGEKAQRGRPAVVLDSGFLPSGLRLLNLSGNPLEHQVVLRGSRKVLTAFWL